MLTQQLVSRAWKLLAGKVAKMMHTLVRQASRNLCTVAERMTWDVAGHLWARSDSAVGVWGVGEVGVASTCHPGGTAVSQNSGQVLEAGGAAHA